MPSKQNNKGAVAARTKTSVVGVHPNLAKERAGATFNTELLTHLLDGGRHRTQRRRYLENIILTDPSGVFDNNSDTMYLHRTDRHIRALAKGTRMIEIARMLGMGSDQKGIYEGHIILSEDFPILLQSIAEDLPLSLHWVMFIPNIHSLFDEEQQKELLPLVRDWKMIGCYAQTELGHGSNIRALETTATYQKPDNDREDGSWIIHSPTLTSTKFWPGTLGRTANTAMVIARLIDGDGVDHGIHNFLVPLRSMDDHSVLPGVTVGDIGPKIGYNVMDNGFAQFDHVKIPRRNMAMRFAHVDRDGTYHKKSLADDATAKVAYITMMQVRAFIVNEAGKNLAMACTVAIRYSAVREQGFKTLDSGGGSSSNTKEELPVLNYRQQQHRLFPLLAASYCFFFSGKLVLENLKDVEKRLIGAAEENKASSSSPENSSFEPVTKAEMADIHATSSALKSFCTMVTADGIEDCRKACGGHGFLQVSGLPDLVTTYLQNPTVEGDNHMLPQHVIKVLLKVVEYAQSTENDEEVLQKYHNCNVRHLLPSMLAMIRSGGSDTEQFEAKNQDILLQDLNVFVKAYAHRAARLLLEVAVTLQGAMAEKPLQEAWNDSLVQMARASKAYALLLLLRNFVDGIHGFKKQGGGSDETKVLTDLALLFALYWTEKDMGDFLEDGYMSQEQASWIRSAVLEMLDVIRPNAVALVDARDFSDFRLKSALGRYDGNVYEHILASSKKDPLNRTEPGPGYEPHLKKLIKGGAGVYTGTASRL